MNDPVEQIRAMRQRRLAARAQQDAATTGETGAPLYGPGDTQPLSAVSTRSERPRRGRIAVLAVGLLAGAAAAISIPALADTGGTPPAASSGATAGGTSDGTGSTTAPTAPDAGTSTDGQAPAAPAGPDGATPPAPGGPAGGPGACALPAPPADGATPPAPPADGATPPAPPADGATPPAPPADGATPPAPPADGATPPAPPAPGTRGDSGQGTPNDPDASPSASSGS